MTEREPRTPVEALRRLVAAIDHVHGSDAYQAVWIVAQSHLGPYVGPKYGPELDAARVAIEDEPDREDAP